MESGERQGLERRIFLHRIDSRCLYDNDRDAPFSWLDSLFPLWFADKRWCLLLLGGKDLDR